MYLEKPALITRNYRNKVHMLSLTCVNDGNKQNISDCNYLGVGPFGVVHLGVVGPAVLALLRTLGVEGVRGVMRGWGVEGALVLPEVGV